MDNRTVTYAKLHQTAHIAGVGDLGSTLPPSNKNVKMEMTLGDHGINIQFLDHKVSAVVPYANVVIMRVLPEAPAAPAKTGK